MKIGVSHETLVVVSCGVIEGMSQGSVDAMGAFTRFFLGAFPINNAQVSLIFASSECVLSAAGPLSVWVLQRFGCKRSVILSAVTMSLAIIVSSVIPWFVGILFCLGIVMGICSNLCLTAAILVLSELYKDPKRKQKAFSLANVGAGIGLPVFSLLYILLLEHYHWRQSLLIIGAICSNLVPIGLLLPKNISKWSKKPEQQLTDQLQPLESAANEEKLEITAEETDKTIQNQPFYKNPKLYLIILGSVLLNSVISVFCTFIFANFHQHDLKESHAAFIITLGGMFSIPTRLLTAVTRHVVTSPTFVQWCFGVAVWNLSVFVICVFTPHWPLTVSFAIIFGLALGVIWSLHPMVISDLFSEKHFAKVLGLSYLGMGVGGAVGPLLAGWAVDRVQNYSSVLGSFGILTALIFLLPILVFYLIKMRKFL